MNYRRGLQRSYAVIAVAWVAPVVGYVFLFSVVPWVYRGFRSTALPE